MRRVACLVALALLAGCVGSEDTGAVAARMEQQDDATCRGRADYQQCRQNLMGYRRQAVVEEQQKQARRDAAGDALIAASRAMRVDPQRADVNVTCFGCR